MFARLYQPTKSAMTSGQANTQEWILEFAPETPRRLDPLMGWTSSDDTRAQVRLRFPTREEAEDYAARHGVPFQVIAPKKRRHRIRPQGYGGNFATDRRQPWTH